MSEPEKINPGAPFKTSRERLGLSINDVAVATKINPRILKALEEGDHAGLPASSFARGFIRSYAAYLKIDAQPILDAYSVKEISNANAAAAQSQPTDVNAVAAPSTQQSDSAPPLRKARKMTAFRDASIASKVFLVGGLLVLVALIFGVRKIVDKYAQERVVEPIPVVEETAVNPDGTPVPPDEASAAAAPHDGTEKTGTSDNATASASTPPVTAATVPATTAPAAPTAAPSSTSASTPSATVTAPAPVPTPATPPTPPAKAATTPAPAAAPAPTPAPVAAAPVKAPEVAKPAETKPSETAKPAAVPQEVILEALDQVEITAVIDGVSQKISLRPEAVHTIKAKSSIRLEIADGGMVNIIHNGRDRGVPGDLGKPAQVKFP